MVKKLYSVYTRNELQPYQVWAFNVADAILIVKGQLIEMGYNSEIVRVTVDDEYGCTDAFNNISVSVRFEECL